MELKEMLKEVFSEWYANVSAEDKAYKRANESFHKLLGKYKLDDDEHLKNFKIKTENCVYEYNFTEKHIQLLKFIRDIDSVNPISRINITSKEQTLENFKEAANAIETMINSSEYPDIANALQSSLRTKEFLSLYSIYDLADKVVQLFQYACESYYADFTIYDQVNKYLDTLLYTYVGTKICGEMMQKEYKNVPDILLHNAHEYDSKLEFKPISIYNGFNSYVRKLFDTVINDEYDSLAIDIEDTQNFKYDYRYEFKKIEHLKDFLNTYYEYCDKSDYFREKFFPMMKAPFSKIADCVITLVSEKIKILEVSEETSEPIINEEYAVMFFDAVDEVSQYLSYINDDNEEEITKLIKELMCIQIKLIYNFAMTYGNGDLLRFCYLTQNLVDSLIFHYQSCLEELVINVYKCIFFDFIFNNIIYEDNGRIINTIIPTQISYKNFPMALNMLSDFKRITGLPNEEIVDKIIKALQDTEKQIETDLKCDDELFSKIDNAIGIYLSKLFEKDKANESKKKSK